MKKKKIINTKRKNLFALGGQEYDVSQYQQIENDAQALTAFNPVAATDKNTLMQEYSNFSPIQQMTLGNNTKTGLSNMFSGVTSGASLGGSFGGVVGGAIGAVAGGLFGAGKTLFQTGKANKAIKQANLDIDAANERNMSALNAKANQFQNQDALNLNANFAAYGGNFNGNGQNMLQHGGEFSNNVVHINNGGSHETNPMQGVMIGKDPQGTPNMVEEGEVMYNGMVFSDRIKATPKELEMMQLPKSFKNKTMAQMAKKVSEESEERPNDPISKRGLEDALSKVTNLQESIKAKMEAEKNSQEQIMMEQPQEANMFSIGGPAFNKYNDFKQIGVNSPFYTPEYRGKVDWLSKNPTSKETIQLINDINANKYGNVGGNTFGVKDFPKYSFDGKQGGMHNGVNSFQIPGLNVVGDPFLKNKQFGVADPNKLENPVGGDAKTAQGGLGADINMGRDNGAWMRFAPIVNSLGMSINSFLQKPDYTHADRVERAASGIQNIDYKPIGNYMQYSPLDRNYYENKLGAQAGATRSAIRNQSGGNRATAVAGLLAADNNAQNQVGNLARQAEEYNNNLMERVETFNRGTNQMNSQMAMQAASANQSAAAQRANLITTAAQMRTVEDNAIAAAKSQNVNNLMNSIGNIGREQFNHNQVKWEIANGIHGNYSHTELVNKFGKDEGIARALKQGISRDELLEIYGEDGIKRGEAYLKKLGIKY